jgi:hypothetical protein
MTLVARHAFFTNQSAPDRATIRRQGCFRRAALPRGARLLRRLVCARAFEQTYHPARPRRLERRSAGGCVRASGRPSWRGLWTSTSTMHRSDRVPRSPRGGSTRSAQTLAINASFLRISNHRHRVSATVWPDTRSLVGQKRGLSSLPSARWGLCRKPLATPCRVSGQWLGWAPNLLWPGVGRP